MSQDNDPPTTAPGQSGERAGTTGHSLVDEHSFRRCIGSFATGVAILTTRMEDGAAVGMAARAVCSGSLRPARVLICIDKRSDAQDSFRVGARIAINVLNSRQEHVSYRFRSGACDELDGLLVRSRCGGPPILEGSLAWLECRIVDALEKGEHAMLIAEVDAAGDCYEDPLLLYRECHARLVV